MATQRLRPGRMFNDFVHDISAGLFPGAVAAVWALKTAIATVDPGRAGLVRQAVGGVWFILAGALACLVVTGIFRLGYWRLNVREGFLETKGRTAVIKHMAFVAAQLLAIWALATL